MEHKNPKKFLLFLSIILIVALFVCGIVFTIIANNRADRLKDFNDKNNTIQEYLLPNTKWYQIFWKKLATHSKQGWVFYFFFNNW